MTVTGGRTLNTAREFTLSRMVVDMKESIMGIKSTAKVSTTLIQARLSKVNGTGEN